MKADISEKIKAILSKEDYSEPEIVYLLVESIKYLELNSKKSAFKIITFYRNWTCHSSLSGDPKTIFEIPYALIKERENAKSAFGEVDLMNKLTDEIKKSFQAYSFTNLAIELESFFKLIGYNSENFKWPSFRIGLYKIITDTPLLIIENGVEIFNFACTKVFIPLNFDDLDIRVTIGSLFFTYALNDRSLEQNLPLWFQNGERR